MYGGKLKMKRLTIIGIIAEGKLKGDKRTI